MASPHVPAGKPSAGGLVSNSSAGNYASFGGGGAKGLGSVGGGGSPSGATSLAGLAGLSTAVLGGTATSPTDYQDNPAQKVALQGTSAQAHSGEQTLAYTLAIKTLKRRYKDADEGALHLKVGEHQGWVNKASERLAADDSDETQRSLMEELTAELATPTPEAAEVAGQPTIDPEVDEDRVRSYAEYLLEKPQTRFKLYKTREGDTLASLAKKKGLDLKTLMKDNAEFLQVIAELMAKKGMAFDPEKAANMQLPAGQSVKLRAKPKPRRIVVPSRLPLDASKYVGSRSSGLSRGGGSGGGSVASDGGVIEGAKPVSQSQLTKNAQVAMKYFLAKGLSKEQAAGIVGNLMHESGGVNPGSVQKGGPGRGIAQWSVGERWQGLLRMAKEKGKSPGDLNVQLDYLWHELNTTERAAFSALKQTTTASQAAVVFQKKFERARVQAHGARASYAEALVRSPAAQGGRSTAV